MLSDLVLNALLIGKKIFENLVRLAGPLFVILATTLISCVIVIHYRALIPFYTDYFSFTGILHLTFSTFMAFNIGFNYFMTIFTSPGYAPLGTTDETEVERLKREPAPRRGEGFSRYCKICKIAKPPRAHHCHICKRCTLKMDHHCPWVSNCVGHNNHKYFVLFLFFLWAGCAYVAMMAFMPFRMTTNYKMPWKGFSTRGTIIFTFVITVSVFLALGFMLAWQMYLVLTGQTTIEFYFNRYQSRQAKYKGEVWVNEYDLGTRKNCSMFFGGGRYWFSWLLPSFQGSVGDGINWITRSQHTAAEIPNLHYV